MLWTIQFFPPCTHHVFLSHCAEDRLSLVLPLFSRLQQYGVTPWLDRHDYPYGRGSRAALRDAILRCRHVVFLVTDDMLTQARGWCVQELAWAELLQDNLTLPGSPGVQNVVLPLYFVDVADGRLPRSVWQAARDKGTFCPPGADRVGWATDQLLRFLRREEELASGFKQFADASVAFRKQLRAGAGGLGDRVTQFAPRGLTPAPGGSPPPPQPPIPS